MPLPGTLEAFGLYLIRTSALVLAAPVLGTGTTFAGVKIGLIFSLAFVLYSASGEPMVLPVSAAAYGVSALREVLIGVFLAFSLHAVFVAVRVAGELIGNEMGFAMAATVDPATGMRTPVVTQVYEVLFILALLAMNGHHWLLRALGESFERAPIGRMSIQGDFAGVASKMFGELFASGLTFAAPVLVLLLLVSVLIGLLARTVPQLNILEFGFNLRIGVALGAMCMFTPMLAPAMEHLLDQLMQAIEAGLDTLGAR
jgi:flagellar biosynthetic protein FliR